MNCKLPIVNSYQFLISVLAAMIVLATCGGSEPPADTSQLAAVSDPTPTQTAVPSTPTEAPTAEPDLPTPTAIPQPTPTLSPTETSAEAWSSDLSGNPDLDYALVKFVRATQDSDGLWTFNTTVRHNDEGWDHYADAWQVVDLEGNILAERVLLHPHDTEQPFTRSQSNIEIPPNMTQLFVRAKCNVHGFGGQEVLLDLTAAEGENFEVVR